MNLAEHEYKYQAYGLRDIRQNIDRHSASIDQTHKRDDVHSAKINAIANEIKNLHVENEALRDEVVTLKAQAMKDSFANRSGEQQAGGYPADDRRGQYRGDNDGEEMRHGRFADEQGRSADRRYRDEEQRYPQQRGPQDSVASEHWYEVSPEVRQVQAGGGVYVFLRFHKSGLADVKLGLKKGSKVRKTHDCHIVGIAMSEDVRILEGIQGWSQKIQDKTRKRGESWAVGMRTEVRDDGLKTDTCILVLWFSRLEKAQTWLDSEPCFKQHDFPSPDGYDAFAVPLNYVIDGDKERMCFMLSEYPRVDDVDKFRDNFGVQGREVLASYGAMPYLVQTVGNRHMRGTWTVPRSVVTVSRFESRDRASGCFNDEKFKNLRTELASPSTTIVFTLSEYI